MGGALAVVVLVLLLIAGILIVPLGLPGLWVMVGGILVYGWLTDFRSVTLGVIVLVVVLAFIGEIVETWLGFRFAKRYGGSKRAGWGALIGGIAGAVIGVPIPIIGSVVGAFAGSFAGAAIFEYTASQKTGTALEAGWGAILGRAAAAASKIGLGLVICVVAFFTVLGA